MKNRFLLSTVICCIFGMTNCHSETGTKKPNIIFILADDLGWADLPAYGNRFNEAPNLDQLANEGMRFVNAYAACPVCSPTRASIQSGQYPARVGITDFIPGHWRPYEEVTVPRNRTQFLPEEIVTIGEAMKSAGYATGYFGKWHLGNGPQHHPLNQGYDEANVGQGYYQTKFNPARETDSSKRFSDLLTDFGTGFIDKNRDNPFFLFIAHYDVHVQLEADQELIDKYLQKEPVVGYPGNAIYAAMVEHLDRSVGAIMKKLEETGLDENTMVVFFSDNGGLISRYDRIPLVADRQLPVYEDSPLKYIASSNSPLKAEKGTVYEGGIRVPMIVRWPGRVPAGEVSEAIVSSVDFYPTLLEIAEAQRPANQVLDGESVIPALTQNRYDTDRAVFWHYPVYHHDVPAGAIRKGDWKLIENQVSGKYSLYNLRFDIAENNNIADLYPEKLSELRTILTDWQKDVKAEFPISNRDFDELRRFEWGKYSNQ